MQGHAGTAVLSRWGGVYFCSLAHLLRDLTYASFAVLFAVLVGRRSGAIAAGRSLSCINT